MKKAGQIEPSDIVVYKGEAHFGDCPRLAELVQGGGKATPRRQVPYDEYAANWRLAFGDKKNRQGTVN